MTPFRTPMSESKTSAAVAMWALRMTVLFIAERPSAAAYSFAINHYTDDLYRLCSQLR
jgi:hypothetical protein